MSIVIFVRQGIDVVTQTSFKSALIYRKDNIHQATDTAWVLNVIRGILLSVGLFLAAPLISRFYREPLLTQAVKFIAVVFILQGFTNINTVLFEKSLDFRKIAIARIGSSLLYSVAVVSLAYVLRSIWALLLGTVLRSLYDVGVSFLIQRIRPRFDFDKTTAWELFHYSKYVTGTAILVFLTTRGDDALIGKLLSLEMLGFYTYAYMIANIPAVYITRMISEIIFPSYSAVSHDIPRLRSAFFSVQKFIAYMTLPVGVLLGVFSREIVLLVLGPQWEPAVAPLRILVVFGLIRSLAATTGPVFKALGKPHVVFWVVFVKLLLILAIIIPLTRMYGLVGASLAVTLPMIAEQFYLWTILKRMISVSPAKVLQQLSFPAVGSLLVGAGMLAWKARFPVDGILTLCLCLLLALLLCGALFWLFDRKFFLSLLKT